MLLQQKHIQKNKNKQKQNGAVLVTGLVFLLIAMMACISTLENAGILSYEQGNSIQKYRLFYLLENELKNLEQPLIKGRYSLENLESLVEDKNIKSNAIESEPEFLEDIWNQENNNIQKSGDYLFLIEYLGSKNLVNINAPDEKPLSTWLFRISVSSKNEHDYWLQSVVEVFPVETLQALNKNKPEQTSDLDIHLDAGKEQEKFASKRIAWFERIANE